MGDVKVYGQMAAASFKLTSEPTPLPTAAQHAALLTRSQAAEQRLAAAKATATQALAAAALQAVSILAPVLRQRRRGQGWRTAGLRPSTAPQTRTPLLSA